MRRCQSHHPGRKRGSCDEGPHPPSPQPVARRGMNRRLMPWSLWIATTAVAAGVCGAGVSLRSVRVTAGRDVHAELVAPPPSVNGIPRAGAGQRPREWSGHTPGARRGPGPRLVANRASTVRADTPCPPSSRCRAARRSAAASIPRPGTSATSRPSRRARRPTPSAGCGRWPTGRSTSRTIASRYVEPWSRRGHKTCDHGTLRAVITALREPPEMPPDLHERLRVVTRLYVLGVA